jgi:CRP/FNR family transcriptional regulator, cyclic AMP receptor protein
MKMSATVDLGVVRGSSIASELSEAECAILAEVVSRRTLKNDEMLIEEDQVDDSLYVIVSGALEVCRRSGGDWVALHVLKKGDLAGELGFIDGQPHSASLRSIGPTEVFILERSQFESLLEKHPKVIYRVMRTILRTVHAILRRMNLQYIELSNYITKQHGRY